MVQEISTQSWFSRIGGAFFGVLIGILLIIGAFVLVFWNEAQGLHTSQSLQQAEKVLITVPPSPIDSKNNHKVVYFTGLATTDETLKDSLLDVETKAIRLHRKVEMYQWKQNKEEKTEKKMGGSEQTITTYTYAPVWSETLIDSNTFKEAAGHQNPNSMPFKSATQVAEKVTVGDYILPRNLVDKISNQTQIDLSEIETTKLESETDLQINQDGNELYLGGDSQTPKVGDIKISLYQVLPQTVSVIAQQTDNTLQPYVAPAGKSVSLLVSGEVSSAEMIHQAQVENTLFTWALRFASLLLMILGIGLILRPLVVLADVVPLFGNIVGFGTGAIAIICGLLLWATATSIAWFVVRPLYAVILMIVVIAVCYALIVRRRRKIARAV